MASLFAGFDVSTQGCKLTVIDIEAASLVHSDRITYDIDLPNYGTVDGIIPGKGAGVAESDPKMWIDAVDMLLHRLHKNIIKDIRCLSVSGQQHGLVALGKQGQLARPTAKLWNDHSTAAECAELTDATGGKEAMIAEIGNVQRPGYTAPKILHMVRHEPKIYAETSTMLLVHNFINFYLTDGIAAMEPGDASGTALWDVRRRAWSNPILSAIDEALASKLPEVRPSEQTIGCIGKSLVERYGFSPHCKVDAGCGDNMYGAIGTGNVEPGVLTVSLGTSGTAYTIMKQPFVDPRGEIAAFCDSTGHYLPLVCVTNLANGYNRFLETHGLNHESFADLIAKTPPGNEGRLLIPWYEGERTPDIPHAAPVYFGFSLDSFTTESLGRAVLEGHVMNLYTASSRLPVQPAEIRLTGGLSRSPVWRQAVADIFESEVVAMGDEGPALGAALHAAWVWLKEDGRPMPLTALVESFVQGDPSTRCHPQSNAVQAYRRHKAVFNALCKRLCGDEAPDPFALRMTE